MACVIKVDYSFVRCISKNSSRGGGIRGLVEMGPHS